MHEAWKSVARNDLYEVSNRGRVRRKGGCMLKIMIGTHGYPVVGLSMKSITRKECVHRLVCEAFHGPSADGKNVNHIDGDKTNNSARNLEWVTPAQNNRHAWNMGLIRPPPLKRGEDNGMAKLTKRQVLEIRCNEKLLSGKELAREYSVSTTVISDVINYKVWNRPDCTAPSPTPRALHPNARLTHCKHGHEFTEENTVHRKSGGRGCRACSRIAKRRHEAKRRQKHAPEKPPSPSPRQAQAYREAAPTAPPLAL